MHIHTGRALVTVAIITIFTLSGCSSSDNNNAKSSLSSSSSSSTSSSGGTIEGLKNVQIHYPPAVSRTSAEQIVVRGITEDVTQVAEIYVNDMPVMSDDGLASWSITLPLDAGDNNFLVTAEAGDGTRSDVDTVIVERTVDIITPKMLTFNQASGDLLLLDTATQSIIRIDAETGARDQLSPDPSTTDNLLVNAQGLALDNANNRLLVYQTQINAEIDAETDAETGNEAAHEDELIDDEETVAEEEPTNIDEFGDESPAIDVNPIIAVDLTTGEQSVFAYTPPANTYLAMSPLAITMGTGVAYVADVEYIFYDQEGNRVARDDENAVLVRAAGIINAIDLSTNDMHVFSSFGESDTELSIVNVLSMTTTGDSDYLYLLDATSAGVRLMTIDKADGTRALLQLDTSVAEGAAPLELTNPRALTLDYLNQRLLLVSGRRILAIALSTGKVSVLSSNEIPAQSPYPMVKSETIALDAVTNTIYTADDAFDAVYAIAGDTGTRTWVSGTGSDDPEATNLFATPACVALSPPQQRAVVCDKLTSTLFAYDLVAGQKSTLASYMDFTAGTSKILYPLSAVERTGTNAFLVLDNNNQRPGTPARTSAPRLLSIDASTGTIDITYLFNNFISLSDILYDAGRDAAYIAGSNRIIELRFNAGGVTARTLSDFKTPNADYRFQGLQSIAMDYQNNRILALDTQLRSVIAVDWNTGQRNPLSSMAVPENGGPSFRTPQALVVDATNNRALVLDSFLDAIIAVDLATGQREIVFQSMSGDADRMYNGKDLALHPFGYVLVVDDGKDTLMAIDLATQQLVTLAR